MPHYAPENSLITIPGIAALVESYRKMSDEELLAIIQGEREPVRLKVKFKRKRKRSRRAPVS